MISNRQKASFRKRRDSGVSEIIGDILILAMTVILFSSIFVFVNAFPTPNAQTFANFNATLSNTTSPTYLNITHEGGQALTSSLTSVVVQINQNTHVYATLNDGNNSSLQQWSYKRWTVGQTWIVNLTGVTSSSIVSVTIIDKANNYVVWSSVLTPKPSHVHPVIQNAWASPNPVKPGSLVTINASIYNGGSSSITLTANASFLNNSAGKMTLYFNPATGFYNTSKFPVNKSTSLGMYPVTVMVTSGAGQHHFYSNYTLMVSVENTGPTIVTASINPNPSTPGSSFNITAYVLDSNTQATIHNVTVKPLGPHYIATLNGTINTASTVAMNLSPYQGVYVLKGNVSSTANYTYYESFEITATDSFGNNATYVVELFLNYFLNPNQYFPSKYLGPTSLSFASFYYNNATSNGSSSNQYKPGYMIDAASVDGGNGIYFDIVIQNHNSTNDLYIDGLSNLYIFTGANNGFTQFESFVVLNTTNGALYSTVSTSSTSAHPKYNNNNQYNGGTVTHPVLYWPTGSQWSNYSVSMSGNTAKPTVTTKTSFILIPASIGGVLVGATVTFGSSSYGGTSSGPFIAGTGTSALITPNNNQGSTVSTNFLELFGYMLPAGTLPWVLQPTTGSPFGQSLPFTGIYWYS